MIFRLLIQLEILFINLFVTNRISKRKYNTLITVFSLLIYTIVLICLQQLLKDYVPASISILVAGISYIIPLSFLYKQSLQRITSTMLFTWTQSLIIFCLSKSLSLLFNESELVQLIIQSVLLFIAFNLIIKYTAKTYKTVLDDIRGRNKNLIVIFAILIFSLAFIFTTYLDTPSVIIVILSLLVSGISITVYFLIKKLVQESKRVMVLNEMAYKDSLTNMKNRISLFKAMDKLIYDKEPFQCIFMDLDQLKTVNDTYGHQIGDQYIIEFTKAVKKSLTGDGEMYRLSGDEFVLITNHEDIDTCALMYNINKNFDYHIEFGGVSVGKSTYPIDAQTQEKLLSIADTEMYLIKQSKQNLHINKCS